MAAWSQGAVAGLAAVGCYLAVYFSAVYYGWLPGDSRLVPRVCHLEADTCRRILDTPQARLFGLPNSLLGVVFYAGMVSYAALAWRDPGPFHLAALGVSGLAVVVGVYLVYVLFRVLRVACPVCLICHGINLLLLILLIITLP